MRVEYRRIVGCAIVAFVLGVVLGRVWERVDFMGVNWEAITALGTLVSAVFVAAASMVAYNAFRDRRRNIERTTRPFVVLRAHVLVENERDGKQKRWSVLEFFNAGSVVASDVRFRFEDPAANVFLQCESIKSLFVQGISCLRPGESISLKWDKVDKVIELVKRYGGGVSRDISVVVDYTPGDAVPAGVSERQRMSNTSIVRVGPLDRYVLTSVKKR